MIKVAVIERSPGFSTENFRGPIRVVHNLCREWDKMQGVKTTTLSNSLINLLQFRYENRFPFLRQILIKQMARSLEIDVLNVQGVSEIGVEVAKICKRRGIPVVFTAHNAAYREKEELGY